MKKIFNSLLWVLWKVLPAKRSWVGHWFEYWLAVTLGDACCRATKFEDRKLGVDLWLLNGGSNGLIFNIPVPVEVTISTDPKIIAHKQNVAHRLGIVSININGWHSKSVNKRKEMIVRQFWKKVKSVLSKDPVLLRKVGDGYQLPLPFFRASMAH